MTEPNLETSPPPTRISRRGALATAGAVFAAGPAGGQTPAKAAYGRIGSLTATPGQRDALAAVLAGASAGMPGCLSYVVGLDAKDPDRIWITEVWASKTDHDAALRLPAVQAAIAKGRPWIAGFDPPVETVPVSRGGG